MYAFFDYVLTPKHKCRSIFIYNGNKNDNDSVLTPETHFAIYAATRPYLPIFVARQSVKVWNQRALIFRHSFQHVIMMAWPLSGRSLLLSVVTAATLRRRPYS